MMDGHTIDVVDEPLGDEPMTNNNSASLAPKMETNALSQLNTPTTYWWAMRIEY
jgi:hypothetical protein